MSAKILRVDCFGKVKIPFSQKIMTKGIKLSDINSSNTDIRIIPYNDSSTGKFVNQSNFNLSWNATQITEQELEI